MLVEWTPDCFGLRKLPMPFVLLKNHLNDFENSILEEVVWVLVLKRGGGIVVCFARLTLDIIQRSLTSAHNKLWYCTDKAKYPGWCTGIAMLRSQLCQRTMAEKMKRGNVVGEAGQIETAWAQSYATVFHSQRLLVIQINCLVAP